MSGADIFGHAPKAPARGHGKGQARGRPRVETDHERVKDNAYFTPPAYTKMLVEVWDALAAEIGAPLGSLIWEPACGAGWMARALEDAGHEVIASDIADYGYACRVQADFHRAGILTTPAGNPPAAIVTNPPYGRAILDPFIKRALSFMPAPGAALSDACPVTQVAFLCNALVTTAPTRDPLFGRRDFAAKIEITERITWIGIDGRPLGQEPGKPKAQGMQSHAWLIWDAAHRGLPVFLRARPGDAVYRAAEYRVRQGEFLA